MIPITESWGRANFAHECLKGMRMLGSSYCCALAVLFCFFSTCFPSKMNEKQPILHVGMTQNVPSSVRETSEEFRSWLEDVMTRYNDHPVPSMSTRFLVNKNKRHNREYTTIVVSKYGNGRYRSIQQAVDAVPEDNRRRVVISIRPGTYIEKVMIPSNKPFITLQGSGRDVTSLIWNDNAGKVGSTFKSATIAVESDSFIAQDISFKNTAPAPPPGAFQMQAVALRISGDKAAFYGCGFYGAQDTLYDHQGRHYFRDCFIQGSIDFIFGDGQSLYESCHLHAIAKSFGAITAQSRALGGKKTGFSFVNCRVTGSGLLYLGRAWGHFSRVVFSYTYMDDIIIPEGWHDWNDPDRRRTVFYGQYKCSGPGADNRGRVGWSYELSPRQAAPFLSKRFINGEEWL